jgi:hypothetical protein
MPSERQIGIKGEREPDLCAVTGRDVRGKHAVTHYGPNGQYVYVLAQVDHLWPQAAPAYGFPVREEKPAQDENVFVLPASSLSATITTTASPEQVLEYMDKKGYFADKPATPRASKSTPNAAPDIKADGMSKESD